jgi:hypothetical protein
VLGQTLFDGSFVTLSLPVIPLAMSLIGKFCPIIAERKIDEEGNRIGKSWVLTRLGGFSWIRLSFAFVKTVVGRIKMSFALHTRGQLIFPVPQEVEQ